MNDSEFDQFLRRESRAESLSEAPFRRAVWQRIEERGAVAGWWERLFGLLSQPMRPAAGVACVLLTILAGVALGSLNGSSPTDPKASYLASITPSSHSHR